MVTYARFHKKSQRASLINILYAIESLLIIHVITMIFLYRLIIAGWIRR